MDARLEALLAAATGPVNWRDLPAEQAETKWTALREWVVWFRREFAFDHRVVAPCWYLHPALVSVLSALRDHWVCCYDPLNSPAGAADWHRSFAQLEPRLREWAARTGCTLGAHRAEVVAEYPNDTAAWQEHVAGDVEARSRCEQAAEQAAAGAS